MPITKVEKCRRVLQWDEINVSLVGKTLKFWNETCGDIRQETNTGVCVAYEHGTRKQLSIRYPDNTDVDSEYFSESACLFPHRETWRVMLIEYNELENDTPNIGRTQCWNCGCPTEMKRDFKDFSIREFCPRCKI